MTAPTSHARTLSDYVDIGKRHRFLLISATVLGMAVGGMYIGLAPREYQSQTQVLVAPTDAETASVSQPRNNKSEINLDTEAQLVTSTAVAELAAEAMGVPPAEVADLAENVDVSVPPNTSILTITYGADSPGRARDGSRAFADAYLANRVDAARTRLVEQVEVIDGELAALQTEREQLTDRMSELEEGDFEYVQTENDRAAVDDEITEWTTLSAQLTSAADAVSAGRVISEPSLPDSAVSPRPLVGVAGGTVMGALLGICVAAIRQRFAARVWHAWDVSRRCGTDVVAVVPRSVDVKTNDVFGSFSHGGRVFGRLRNEVVAALGPTPRRVIVVAGVASGAGSSVCTANLAASLSRTGGDVVAVAAHPGGPVTVPSLLDAPSVPGLSDVLADRADLDDAAHRAARYPLLEVIGPGGCGSAAGPSRGTIIEIYQALRERSAYVVVDAAPMAVSSDAQLLAADADAVLLVVECGKDKVEDVAEAVQAMRRIDAPLLGAIVLPRLPARSEDEPSTPAPLEDRLRESRRRRETGRRAPSPRRRRADDPPADDRPTDTIPKIRDVAGPEDPVESESDEPVEPDRHRSLRRDDAPVITLDEDGAVAHIGAAAGEPRGDDH